jgi:type VI secretion system protein ImpB
MVLGEFNPNEEKKPVEQKKAINVNKQNFNDVLKNQNLSVEFVVPNRLSDDGSDMTIKLKLDGMKDFSPENIVENVAEMKKLMELRQSLIALKGPLGNVPAFRKAIENAISDPLEREKLLFDLTSAQ